MEPEIATAFIDREPVPVPRDLYNFAKQCLWCWPLVLMATFGLGVVTARGWSIPTVDVRLFGEGPTYQLHKPAPIVNIHKWGGWMAGTQDIPAKECRTQ